MLSFLDPVLVHLHDLLALLDPVVPAAVTVVALTLLVRLALHPLNRRSQHAMVRRRDLQPRLDELRERHRDDPQALSRATVELHRAEGVPVVPGGLSILIQIPIFSMIYRLFTAPVIDGQHNQLLDHTLLGTALSARLLGDAGEPWVFLFLVALTLVVAAFAAWQMRRHLAEDRAATRALAGRMPAKSQQLTAQQQAMADTMEQVTKVVPLMSFFTVLAVASLPLAAGLYLVTSSTWGLLERASLRRIRHRPRASLDEAGGTAYPR